MMALSYYQKYQKENGSLDSYVNYKIGQVYNSTLQPTQGIVYFEKAAAGPATILLTGAGDGTVGRLLRQS